MPFDKLCGKDMIDLLVVSLGLSFVENPRVYTCVEARLLHNNSFRKIAAKFSPARFPLRYTDNQMTDGFLGIKSLFQSNFIGYRLVSILGGLKRPSMAVQPPST